MLRSRLIATAALVCLAGCGRSEPHGKAGPAVPPPLDRSFGTLGTTKTAFDCSGPAYPSALVEVAGGGFVAGGIACRGWGLVGYTANGAVNPAFGSGGSLVLFPDAGFYPGVATLLERPDGTLIALGQLSTAVSIRQLAANGAVDIPFAAAIDAALELHSWLGYAMALEPDGKLLVASGETVFRISTDGSRDATFATQGVATVSLFGGHTGLQKLLLLPDGRILVFGHDTSGGLPGVPFVARLSAEGALDPSYGVHGVATIPTSFPSTVWATDAALQTDGALVIVGSVTGWYSEAKSRAVAWRLTPEGKVDIGFGTDGQAQGPMSPQGSQYFSVSALPNRKFVAVGTSEDWTIGDLWLVSRYTSGGALDATFASGGVSAFSVGVPGFLRGAAAVVTDPSGYVVAGQGFFSAQDGLAFGLARLVP